MYVVLKGFRSTLPTNTKIKTSPCSLGKKKCKTKNLEKWIGSHKEWIEILSRSLPGMSPPLRVTPHPAPRPTLRPPCLSPSIPPRPPCPLLWVPLLSSFSWRTSSDLLGLITIGSTALFGDEVNTVRRTEQRVCLFYWLKSVNQIKFGSAGSYVHILK